MRIGCSVLVRAGDDMDPVIIQSVNLAPIPATSDHPEFMNYSVIANDSFYNYPCSNRPLAKKNRSPLPRKTPPKCILI